MQPFCPLGPLARHIQLRKATLIRGATYARTAGARQRLNVMLRAFRRVQQYIKHDIKEIVAPSALPEPPGEEARRLTAAEIWKAVRLGTRDYLNTFKKKKREEVAGVSRESGPEEPPIIDELLGAARGGAQSMKPLLQNLYRTRASAYQRAVRSFVEGYREGLSELPKASSGPEAPLSAQAPKRPQARSESGRPE